MESCAFVGGLASLRTGLEASCSGRFVDDCQARSHIATGRGGDFGPYGIVRQLNKGATAVVYEAVDRSCVESIYDKPRKVALKVFNTSRDGNLEVPASVVQTEIACSSRLQHRNIAALLEVIPISDRLAALAIELVNGPDLLEFVESCKRRVPEDVGLYYFRQLLDAITYMHANGVAHRDLKPENCVIDLHTHTLKVVDFGLAGGLDDCVPLGCGTVTAIAPECIAQDAGPGAMDGRAVDVWGLGITLYIMLAGRFPFQDAKRPLEDQRTIRNTIDGRINPLPSHISAQARDLILSMLQTDPAARPSLGEVWEHAALKKRVAVSTVAAYETRFAGSYGLPSLTCGHTILAQDRRQPGMQWGPSAFLMDRFFGNSDSTPALPWQQPVSRSRRAKEANVPAAPFILQPEIIKAALQASMGDSEDPSEGTVTDEPAQVVVQPTSKWQQSSQEAASCGTIPGPRRLYSLLADTRLHSEQPTMSTSSSGKRLASVPEASDMDTEDTVESQLHAICALGSISSWRSEGSCFALGDVADSLMSAYGPMNAPGSGN